MKDNYFLSQVHQPFFVLAFINAIIFMLMFMLSYKGILPLSVDVVNFHAFSLIYLFITPAFIAFIFTTFPKFLATPVILKTTYLKVFALFFAGTVCFIVGAILSPILYKISMAITGIGFIYAYKILFDMYKTSKVTNKYDSFWILIGASFGVLGVVLFTASPFTTFNIQVSIYLYLFLLAFSVAQKMITAFSQCQYDKDKNFLKYVFILLVLHVVLETLSTNLSFVPDILIAVYIAKEIYRWKLPFPNPNPLLWILHLSLFWIPLAFFLSAISNGFEYFYEVNFLALDIHSLMIGFLVTVLIGFGTRVTLGHSGNKMVVNKFTKYIFIWTQIVVLLRIATSIVASFGMNYMIFFDISVTFWLLLFLMWSWQFLRVLTHGKKFTHEMKFTAFK